MSLLNVCLPLFGTALHLITPYSQLSIVASSLPSFTGHPPTFAILLRHFPLATYLLRAAACPISSPMLHSPLPAAVYLPYTFLYLPATFVISLLCFFPFATWQQLLFSISLHWILFILLTYTYHTFLCKFSIASPLVSSLHYHSCHLPPMSFDHQPLSLPPSLRFF